MTSFREILSSHLANLKAFSGEMELWTEDVINNMKIIYADWCTTVNKGMSS